MGTRIIDRKELIDTMQSKYRALKRECDKNKDEIEFNRIEIHELHAKIGDEIEDMKQEHYELKVAGSALLKVMDETTEIEGWFTEQRARLVLALKTYHLGGSTS